MQFLCELLQILQRGYAVNKLGATLLVRQCNKAVRHTQ